MLQAACADQAAFADQAESYAAIFDLRMSCPVIDLAKPQAAARVRALQVAAAPTAVALAHWSLSRTNWLAEVVVARALAELVPLVQVAAKERQGTVAAAGIDQVAKAEVGKKTFHSTLGSGYSTEKGYGSDSFAAAAASWG